MGFLGGIKVPCECTKTPETPVLAHETAHGIPREVPRGSKMGETWTPGVPSPGVPGDHGMPGSPTKRYADMTPNEVFEAEAKKNQRWQTFPPTSVTGRTSSSQPSLQNISRADYRTIAEKLRGRLRAQAQARDALKKRLTFFSTAGSSDLDRLILAEVLNGRGQKLALECMGWTWVPESRTGTNGRKVGGWTHPKVKSEEWMLDRPEDRRTTTCSHMRAYKIEKNRAFDRLGETQ